MHSSCFTQVVLAKKHFLLPMFKFYPLPYGHDVTLVDSPSTSSVLSNFPFVTIIPSYPQFLLVFEPTTIMEALKHALSRQQVCLYHFSSPEKVGVLGVGV